MEHPWFRHYPSEVPKEINPDEYSTIIDLLEKSAEVSTSKPAFVNLGKTITFSETNKLSSDFAAYLQSTGLKKGDRIAIQMPNLLQNPIVIFGAIKAGLIVVNTNPLYTPREMKHQFKDSGAVAIVILANFASHLQEIIQDTAIKHVIITEIGDLIGGFKEKIIKFVVKKVKKMVPSYSIEGAVTFKDAMTTGANSEYQKPSLDPQDIAFLQYTGGTTGVSKGATLTHRNICANTVQARAWFIGIGEDEETIITALPLYHIFALTVNCFIMYTLGARNVLITNPRDMKAFIKDLKKYPFSFISGVNTLFNGLLNQEKFRGLDFSKLKLSLAGGMALQRPVAEKWKEVTGNLIVEGYGLSETSPILTANPLDGNARIGSVGIPLPNTELKIMDEAGKEVPIGEPGEICCRGPQVMTGYWERPDETAKCFFGEWFRTGDIGVQDEEGWFKIVDRKKDMILVSGFNVYPNEIEEVLAAHDKILEVAAVGVPDERTTEAVKIFVVKNDPSLTEDEVREHADKNLTRYKCPKYIEFRDELPKSNVGKILRRMLKEKVSG